MYYVMNDIKEVLTTSGVMMQDGFVIGTDVHIECNLANNTIKYSYESEHGAKWGSTNYSPASTPVYDTHQKVTGLMFNKPDPDSEYYVCWNNS